MVASVVLAAIIFIFVGMLGIYLLIQLGPVNFSLGIYSYYAIYGILVLVSLPIVKRFLE